MKNSYQNLILERYDNVIDFVRARQLPTEPNGPTPNSHRKCDNTYSEDWSSNSSYSTDSSDITTDTDDLLSSHSSDSDSTSSSCHCQDCEKKCLEFANSNEKQ